MERTMANRMQWVRAMEAAVREQVEPVELDAHTYVVKSTSEDFYHYVTLNEHGKIAHCSMCRGWEGYLAGRSRPCKHAGAVARRLIEERGLSMPRPLTVVPAQPVPVHVSGDEWEETA